MIKKDLINIYKYLKTKKIGVLKGGSSPEREISLKTGKNVENTLKKLNLNFISIDIAKKIFLEKIKKIDIAFIALHGPLGEDGKIQGLLECMKIPYTGSGPLASALAMDKSKSKLIFKDNNIPTPDWFTLEKKDIPYNSDFPFPCVVKPSTQGSTIGVSLVKERKKIKSAIKLAFKYSDTVIVEKYIKGRELTVGILGDEILPIIEIIPKRSYYDYYSKYSRGGSKHIIPANLTDEELSIVKKNALKAFKVLDCKAFGRVDLILASGATTPTSYVLEVNTIPGMTETSLFPEAAKVGGLSFEETLLAIFKYSLFKS